MLNFGPTFIWVIVNLFVLYMILKRVLFKPVTKLMEERTNSIKRDLDNAEKSKADAAFLKQKYEDMLKSVRGKADKILTEARERAEREYTSTLAAAKKDSEVILEKARAQIEAERQQMLKDTRNQVAGLALAAAAKVLEANMDNEANRVLVDKFIDEAGAA